MSDPSDRLSRRAALQGIGVGLGSIAGIGCASSESVVADEPADKGPGKIPPAGDPGDTTPVGPDPDPPEPPTPNYTAKELLAGIEHIVVLIMENRSFDHMLGALALDPGYVNKATVNGLKGTESNPGTDDVPVPVFKLENLTPEDPPHGWVAMHNQFNDGANDGFVKAHGGPSEKEAMGYHDRSQLPVYYWLADNFAICDNWFSSVLGPTWPNRFYINATTSSGKKANNEPIVVPSIWSALKAKGASVKNYAAAGVPWLLGGLPATSLDIGSDSIGTFFTACQQGTLPNFTMIDPDYLSSDDHPSHNVQRGQLFVSTIYKALAESPLWFKTLLIITYDECGGFFDHVPPPKTVDALPEFEQLGFRVPALVIGPTVKKGYVCKTQLEHCSIAATLKTRWDIADLTPRMAATKDITDCIDPVKVAKPAVPPLGLPTVAVTMSNALYDGVGIDSQPDLTAAAKQRGFVPVDSTNPQERISGWLEHAKRLNTVRIIGP
jgi:phospholipase C